MTTRKGNESIIQKENCFVEEMKEVELTSRREKFIYNTTYNPVDLNKVSHFSGRGRAPSRLPMKKLKSLSKKTRKVRLFVWRRILKNTPLSSKIHWKATESCATISEEPCILCIPISVPQKETLNESTTSQILFSYQNYGMPN